jgi:hypothetical protein
MCGIVGFSGSNVDPNDMKLLLLVARERGKHSTGIGFKRGKKIAYHKAVVEPREYIAKYKIPSRITAMLGHTRNPSYNVREKTKGPEGAHPFIFGNIVGAHNGNISNHATIRREAGLDYDDHPVDSEMAFYLIDKIGVEKAIPQLSGSMALCWIDTDGDLHLYRYNNPTHYGWKQVGKHKQFFFASRAEYLHIIGIKETEETKPEHHYIIRGGEIVSEKKLDSPKKYSSTTSWTSRGGRSYPNSMNQNGNVHGAPRSRPSENSTQDIDNVVLGHELLVKPLEAPEGADMLFSQGRAMWFWYDDQAKMVNIEASEAFGQTVTDMFSIDDPTDLERLKNHYLPIYNEVKRAKQIDD